MNKAFVEWLEMIKESMQEALEGAEHEKRDAQYWKVAAETQKENNLTILKEVERLKSENDWMKTSLSEAKSLMHLSYFIQAQIIVEQAIQRIQEASNDKMPS
ncbi:hypothetical protein ACE3MS_15370 [Paenibacillus dendritiformis]|uniref:hypothetical protein n=1 Tax=Paenibacillus dendritiformis TaxID=130049 RepID=UPI0036538B89